MLRNVPGQFVGAQMTNYSGTPATTGTDAVPTDGGTATGTGDTPATGTGTGTGAATGTEQNSGVPSGQ